MQPSRPRDPVVAGPIADAATDRGRRRFVVAGASLAVAACAADRPERPDTAPTRTTPTIDLHSHAGT